MPIRRHFFAEMRIAQIFEQQPATRTEKIRSTFVQGERPRRGNTQQMQQLSVAPGTAEAGKRFDRYAAARATDLYCYSA